LARLVRLAAGLGRCGALRLRRARGSRLGFALGVGLVGLFLEFGVQHQALTDSLGDAGIGQAEIAVGFGGKSRPIRFHRLALDLVEQGEPLLGKPLQRRHAEFMQPRPAVLRGIVLGRLGRY
jgi:hypothetical protein